MSDEPGPDPGPHRRGLDRFPGVLRPSAAGAGGPRGPVQRREPADRGGRRGHRGGRRDRHRAVEPDRLDRADPRGADQGPRHGTGARRRPGRGGQPDRRRRGAQGPGRSDAHVPRPRIERPGSGPDLPRHRHRLRARHVDAAQEPEIAALGVRTLVIDTVMGDHPGRARLARDVLEFARRRASR